MHVPKGLKKKKSLLEAAEAKAGLLVKQYSAEQLSGKRRDARLESLAGTGHIALKVTRYLDDDQIALCVAMHTYMGLLSKIAGPHFDWNEASQCAEVSELGKRLLLCADLLDEHLVRKIPLGWNDEDVYLHSAYVGLFRASLVVSIDKIRTRQGKHFVDCRLLTQEDVALLQRALKTALRWMARRHSCSANRRLYVEMLKTKRSIAKYVAALESTTSQAVAVLVKMDVVEGYGSSWAAMAGKGDPSHIGVQPYLAFFKTASKYIAMLQKTWPESLIGHFSKVTRSNQGAPQCVILLFLQPESGAHSWKTKLQALHVDFNKQRTAKLYDPSHLTVTDLTPSIRKQSGVCTQQVRQLIEDLFVKELRYRRLNLPARRRSWS
ncbi:hypothetical protein [Comamonas jiangduensis]|uniref:hypothetical protein n=1 Tax=Comamonas jiangduensis TaxID=1194168 RepID=UPI003BF80FED